ncbi:WxcM-like domain-containing protein [Mangrovimonas spongiae]|uniref:WxcM-like domain-containing protein n=1 Tax=Mangrovimonas spongiae TaxID=2494697 RepID=A0A3R9M7N3_9FLAO|nr:FdtA/QdtA family cupin domain-containing protein [Mangrovimonas spongiae]RSK39170.1 WxcM-like domain-containing protein [Mangrovimonas spongiae]
MNTIKDIEIIDFPVVEDSRGNLAIVEKQVLPYEFKRVYYLYDVPSTSYRGGHSHKQQHETLVAISGSFEVVLNDGTQEQSYFLNKPNKGLHIKPGIWRELKNFSSGAVCLVLSSDVYLEEDYIRDFNEFLKSRK